MPHYVYILLCRDGSYYTGYTKNPESRFEWHKQGRGAKYTRMRKPERLVYVEEFESRRDAMRREREIKDLSHDQKTELMNRARRRRP
jgi:putative endonuclease